MNAKNNPPNAFLSLRDKRLRLDHGPRLMGVLNVTSDSFSDGGLYLDPQAAVEYGLRLAEQGADLIDVGGESTRPGAEPVNAAEQIRRVVPVISGLRQSGLQVPLSVDTRSAAVAEAALDAGADAVNDVAALREDQRMVEVVGHYRAGLFLMHMRGTPANMQTNPHYDNVVGEVRGFLDERVAFAVAGGVRRECLAVDPGIGCYSSIWTGWASSACPSCSACRASASSASCWVGTGRTSV